MKYVSVRELKNQASKVVREAERGDVIVTSRGRPVALLQRLGQDELEDYLFYSAGPVRQLIERRWKAYRRGGKTVSLDQLRRPQRRGRG